ncbi:MAG: hydantoinase/oxoprolinase family protein [Arenicellales bacterium]|jgi:N-methylhydantoinase A|nr:hydantoinase/oxoprolinase family protein [Arenicellales bacterium]
MLWVGIDVGGTFTDIVVYDDKSGTVSAGKSPSTPSEPSDGVVNALKQLSVDLAKVSIFRHGATVATNTALERKGAQLGVITTQGFRDVLIIGRGNRTQLYDIKAVRPAGLVKRSRVLEVPERVGPDGQVITSIDEAAVIAATSRLRELGVEAIAVCFLHSYANPEPEREAVKLVERTWPDIPVCNSADVLAEHREYERFSTTALNAYIAPRMSGYLHDLAANLSAQGLTATPEVMSSSGGSWPLSEMARLPVNSMLSGPAGGVTGALEFARTIGVNDIITYDMGGTSTDTCLIRSGRYALTNDGMLGGLPNRAPAIEINTVGAGGGSLAYLGDGGFLNVGPRSAGARPGPACYGHGGTEPTVTDANVVLARLRPMQPLGGEIQINVEAANQAVDRLAKVLGLDRMKTAEGIIQIAITRMTVAIKEISVMRGIDPRDFSLFAFGGAGPLHAALIAEELDMARVIIPPLSGAFSAYGLLVADRRRDYSITWQRELTDVSITDLQDRLKPMRDAARLELLNDGFPEDRIRIEHSADMRYRGQAFELSVPLTQPIQNLDEVEQAFRQVYEERYTHADEGAVELVSLRIAAYGLTDKPQLPPLAESRDIEAALIGQRPCHFTGKNLETEIYQREHLPAGARLTGPVLIEESGSITMVPPGFNLEHHPSGAMILTRDETEQKDSR